ncbi:MAG: hypothetical protein AAFY11_06770 [Cyanobacteria bacterium J06641_5]
MKAVLLWLPLIFVGVGNGVLREVTYGKYLPELRAHQVSCFTGIATIWLAGILLFSQFPLTSIDQAWRVGAIWASLTVAFEFVFGHFAAGHSWRWLLHNYNVAAGRLWPLVLAGILVAPAFAYWLNIGSSIQPA